jgi:ribosome-interacting GTPase 1
VEPEETAIAMKRLDKHVSAAMDMDAMIQELLKMMFSMQSMLRLYSKGHQEK